MFKKYVDKGWGRILNASSIGVKFEGVNLILIIPSQNILTSLYHLIIKYGVKNVLINALRIGVTDTKIHKKIINKNVKKELNLYR